MKKIISIRTVLEIILIVIVVVQGYYLYSLPHINSEEIVESMSGLQDIIDWQLCNEPLAMMTEFAASEDYEAMSKFGEGLLEKEFNDFTLYVMTAGAYYKIGNKERAIELLNLALQADYKCFDPREKGRIFDKAGVHIELHEIFNDMGSKKQANEHYAESERLARLCMQDNFTPELFQRLRERFSFNR